MNSLQRISEEFDKENPPHPTLASKKSNAPEELQLKKTVLGENPQIVSKEPIEEECPSSPIGDRLLKRKRQFQSKPSHGFMIKLF